VSARELITEHLDLWAGAVTKKSSSGRGSNSKVELTGIKKLRELILELAFKGKLVKQNPDAESAEILLARLQDERLGLERSKKIKKKRKTNESTNVDNLTALPGNWRWSQLGEVAFKLTDGSHNPPKDAGSGIPMLSSQNVNFGKIDFDRPTRYLTVEDYVKEDTRTEARPGDVLLTIVASLGRAAVVPQEAPQFALQRSVAVIGTPISSEFLAYQLIAPQCLDYYDTHGKGTAQKGIYLGKLAAMPIAVPSLEEQHRIVQKVDELMALCDRLEQQTSDQLEAHETLVDTLLGTLTQSENATELADNWARLAAHFDTLFTTEQSVNKLKQAILQLAVMGRLVAQDTGDEPVTVLLRKISEQKARATNLDRAKTFSPISDSEQPFQLSSCWQFKRLGDLAHVFAGNSFKSQDFNNLSGSRVIKITNVGVGELIETPDFLPPEFAHEYSKYKVLTGDLILALTRPYISTGLKVAICPNAYNQALLNQRVAAIRPFLDGSFLYIYMQSKYVLGLYQARFGSSGLQPNLKMSDVTNLIIPVPPIAEQHRIVQKVDELMALCDRLKERLNQASDTRCQLADTVVEGALN
jgi:type I restriction enzyme S subunit